ncbi:MAG TPA: Hsp20/alpha crystallin family protein [Planctomycetota bacterium]|nr:Hsp20/alpha crystallin family protein [Planctomycetota bacterium]
MLNPLRRWVGIGDEAPWAPRADLYRTRGGWLIKVDLAGVHPTQIDVALQGSRLIVSGSRRDEVVKEGWQHYQMEITYSRFERVLELPESGEGWSFHSQYRQGMLLIELKREGCREEA